MTEKIEQLKIEKTRISEALLQAILDSDLPKLLKLMQIEETESLPFHTYLIRPIAQKYSDIFTAQIEEKYGVQDFHIIDSWPLIHTECFNRSEHVSLASQLENTIEDVAYSLEDGDPFDKELVYKQEVVVLRNRKSGALDEYKITVGQLIDDIYEWVVSNRYIGFTFDW